MISGQGHHLTLLRQPQIRESKREIIRVTTRQNFTYDAFTEQECFEIYHRIWTYWTVARFMSEMISESNMLV